MRTLKSFKKDQIINNLKIKKTKFIHTIKCLKYSTDTEFTKYMPKKKGSIFKDMINNRSNFGK